MAKKTVGFIGVGRLGRPLVRHALASGFPVHAFDISPEALRQVEDLGARSVGSPRKLAEICDLVVTALPGPPEIESAVLGENGVASGLRPGAVLVEMSTSSPSLSRKIASVLEQRGAHFLDCPVSGVLTGGGVVAAERGELTLIVGGPAEVLDMCREVLEPMASTIMHVGGTGAGHTAKLLNQMLLLGESVLAMEVLAVAAKSGIDLPTLFELVGNSTGNSWCWQNRVPRLLGGDTRTAQLDLWHKDLGLATTMAREVGIPTFVADVAFQVLQMAKAMGLGKEDGSIAMAGLYERAVGVRIDQAVSTK